MTQKSSKIFIDEIYSKPPKRIMSRSKLVYFVLIIFGHWIFEIENIRNYRYVLVTVDNFSKFGWTIPLKNKNVQKIKDSSEKIVQKENQT